MVKHNLALSLLLLAGIGITTITAAAEFDSASPKADYSQEEKNPAKHLTDKTLLVKSQFEKATNRLQYWQELAAQCVELNGADNPFFIFEYAGILRAKFQMGEPFGVKVIALN